MQSDAPDRRLDSWKEIAAFFCRDVRTVQRWQPEGLPVHRRPGARRSGVFAYESELSAWLSGRAHDLVGRAQGEAGTTSATPSPARGGRTRMAVAISGVAFSAVALAWIAASSPRAAAFTFPVRTLATSPVALHAAHWADVDGDGGRDLIVNTHGSTALIFRSARSKQCRDEAIRCADIRIHLSPACQSHTSRAGDFNGDGVDDLLVACLLGEPDSLISTGPVHLLWGRKTWPADVRLPDDADVALSSVARHDDRVTGCLHQATSADLNHDGIDDLLIGGAEVPFAGRLSAGATFVYFGRRDWPAALTLAQADVTIGGSRTGEGAGGDCAVDDFDGDGRADLAIHAPETMLWNMLGGQGRTYLLRGRDTWPRVIDLAAEPVMRIDGLPDGTWGQRTALADVDGDARADLIFSAPQRHRAAPEEGRVGVWRGSGFSPAVLPFASADVVFRGRKPTSALGRAMIAFDFDADGTKEVIAAELGTGTLRVLSARAQQAVVDIPLRGLAGESSAPEGLAGDGDTIAIVYRPYERWEISLLQPFIPVAIDVRPYSADDLILKPGVTAIAVLGANRQPPIEPASMRAEGAAAFAHARADVNGDGIADVIGYFKTEQMQLPDGARVVTIVARTVSGHYVRGTSPVRVVAISAGR